LIRYAIDDASADWSVAEAQVGKLVREGGKATVVSVKGGGAGQKRKADDGGDVVREKEKDGEKGKGKKTRRAKKPRRSHS
jgi:N-acetyltransferase 10